MKRWTVVLWLTLLCGCGVAGTTSNGTSSVARSEYPLSTVHVPAGRTYPATAQSPQPTTGSPRVRTARSRPLNPEAAADPHFQAAAAWSRTVLATVPMTKDAVLDTTSPDSDDLDWTPPTSTDVQVYLLYQVPSTFQQVTAQLEKLPMPRGFSVLQGGINQVADPTGNAWSSATTVPTAAISATLITYGWQAHAGGTRVRVKVQVSWIPTRQPRTFVDPAAVTALTINLLVSDYFTGSSAKKARSGTRTITDRDAINAAVERFNGFPLQGEYRHTCVPAPRSYTVTFHLADRSVIARFQSGLVDGIEHPNSMAFDCDAITVTGLGDPFGLVSGDAFDAELATLK